jgi:hypothetical protein
MGSFKKNRGISPTLGFQFWPKSESLGLSDTKPQLMRIMLKLAIPERRNIFFKFNEP